MFIKLFKIGKKISYVASDFTTANVDYKEYNTYGAVDFTLLHDNGYTDLPLPEQEAKENALIKLFGQKESFTIAFTMIKADSDRYGGTGVTGGDNYGNEVLDQINFINKYLLTSKSSDEFGFQLIESPSTVKFQRSPSNVSGRVKDGGLFSNLSITYASGVDKADVRLTFTVGTVQ